MKAQITFKTPDALTDTAKELADQARDEATHLDEDDADELFHETYNKVEKALSKFISSGEYVTIEVDIEAGTAKVLGA